MVTHGDLDFTVQLQMEEAMKACSLLSSKDHEVFRLYFKGLVSHDEDVKMWFAGIGVAICDTNDCCLHKWRKSFLLDADDRGTEQVELEALNEALDVALNLGLKRVHISCDCISVYEYLTGETQPTNNKIAALVEQLNLIQSKFLHHALFHVKQNDIKFVYKLAADAITSEAKWAKTEQCTICVEYVHHYKIFSVNECLHRYCFSCMRKHVEARLLQGKLPECPHEKCESEIGIESCKKFLNQELYDIMRSRVREASIPPADKVYCPFPNCSALMSKTEVKEHTPSSSYTAGEDTGMRKCVECNSLFCINCKVPWHDDITCSDYTNSFLFQSSNEAKLKSLATKKQWRECIQCKNMVELAAGCFHISCRCGYEFCYTCGAEWVNKNPTCRCPIWDERNIIYP